MPSRQPGQIRDAAAELARERHDNARSSVAPSSAGAVATLRRAGSAPRQGEARPVGRRVASDVVTSKSKLAGKQLRFDRPARGHSHTGEGSEPRLTHERLQQYAAAHALLTSTPKTAPPAHSSIGASTTLLQRISNPSALVPTPAPLRPPVNASPMSPNGAGVVTIGPTIGSAPAAPMGTAPARLISSAPILSVTILPGTRLAITPPAGLPLPGLGPPSAGPRPASALAQPTSPTRAQLIHRLVSFPQHGTLPVTSAAAPRSSSPDALHGALTGPGPGQAPLRGAPPPERAFGPRATEYPSRAALSSPNAAGAGSSPAGRSAGQGHPRPGHGSPSHLHQNRQQHHHQQQQEHEHRHEQLPLAHPDRPGTAGSARGRAGVRAMSPAQQHQQAIPPQPPQQHQQHQQQQQQVATQWEQKQHRHLVQGPQDAGPVLTGDPHPPFPNAHLPLIPSPSLPTPLPAPLEPGQPMQGAVPGPPSEPQPPPSDPHLQPQQQEPLFDPGPEQPGPWRPQSRPWSAFHRPWSSGPAAPPPPSPPYAAPAGYRRGTPGAAPARRPGEALVVGLRDVPPSQLLQARAGRMEQEDPQLQRQAWGEGRGGGWAAVLLGRKRWGEVEDDAGTHASWWRGGAGGGDSEASFPLTAVTDRHEAADRLTPSEAALWLGRVAELEAEVKKEQEFRQRYERELQLLAAAGAGAGGRGGRPGGAGGSPLWQSGSGRVLTGARAAAAAVMRHRSGVPS